jgi:Tfp pilus assembly protein PilF
VTIPFEFVLDDAPHILNNKNVSEASRSIAQIFLSPIEPGNLYRPFLILTYRLTYGVFGLNPEPFHITNIFLHLINTLTLYFFARKIRAISKLAWPAAAIFAVHPIHVEAVANISGRSELLCHFFGLGAAWFALKSSSTIIRGLIIGFLLTASLLTKESGISYLLIIPLLMWYQNRGLYEICKAITAPVLITLCIYSYLRIMALGDFFASNYATEPIDNPLVAASFIDRIFTAIYVLGFGFFKSIWPVKLSSDYSLNELTTLRPGANLLEFLVVVSVLTAFIYCLLKIRERGLKGFIGGWIISCLLVTSNILFLSGTIFGERHLYLSSFAICLVLAWVLVSIDIQIISKALITLIIGLFFLKTLKENWAWQSPHSLFSAQLLRAPQSAKSSYNFGMLLMLNGQNKQAIQYLKRSLAIYPNSPMANLWLGRMHKHLGQRDLALNSFESALNLAPHDPEILFELGRLFLEKGKSKEADTYFSLMKTKYPDNIYTALIEYLDLNSRGDQESADALLTKLLAYDPANYILNEIKNGTSIRN